MVTYIEVTPAAEAEAGTLLRRIAAASRKEAGNLRYDVLQQNERRNQFAILEAWSDAKAFEAGLIRDGYQGIEIKELPRDYRAASHAHDFDVRALVLAGEITLTSDGGSRSFAAGGILNA